MQRNHEAMLEFGGNITVKFICDRGVSHELVRHRLVSFAQESTRYCNYGNNDHIEFIIPCWCKEIEEQETNVCHFIDDSTETIWLHTMYKCEEGYLNMINQGWSPQQARSVLPNSLKTEINMSANIREWRHIFKLRTSNAAHPQMRELMCPLLDEFKQRIPILFDDITYK
jgi:thymidylate synthase (FAD)